MAAKEFDVEVQDSLGRTSTLRVVLASEHRSALASSEKAIPQPIETAPKDKNGVLAYSPKFYQGKGGWVAAVWLENGCASAWHSNPGGWRFDPTHWLPMPKVPTECERPEGKST